MSLQVLKGSRVELTALERAFVEDKILALAAMGLPILVGYLLTAALALEVDNLQLIAQIAIHQGGLEAVTFAAGAHRSLLEPLLQAVVIEKLLAVVTLHAFLIDYVEADGAQEGINELLVCLHGVFLGELVVASECEDVLLSLMVNRLDELEG